MEDNEPGRFTIGGLLFLFTLHSPPWDFVIEFPDLVPATWPPALEPLRQAA